MELSMMVGRQLPFFSVLVPFWLIWAFAGWRKMLEIWPAILVAGVSFAVPQFMVSNYHGPMLVDVIAALISMASLTLFLKVWKPATIHTSAALSGRVDNSKVEEEKVTASAAFSDQARPAVMRAWMPWIILTVFVFPPGAPRVQEHVRHPSSDRSGSTSFGQTGSRRQTDARGQPFVRPGRDLHHTAPANRKSAAGGRRAESRRSGVQIHLVHRHWQRHSAGSDCRRFADGLFDPATDQAIPAHVVGGAVFADHHCGDAGAGFLTRYSGLDATMGLAFAATGIFYPMFGTLLGWLGVALTGSDTASNVLFGGLQRVTSEQFGISPGTDGGGEQFRWGDGQNGRCAIDRGRLDRDPLVRA
jgi:lactate permease